MREDKIMDRGGRKEIMWTKRTQVMCRGGAKEREAIGRPRPRRTTAYTVGVWILSHTSQVFVGEDIVPLGSRSQPWWDRSSLRAT